MVAEGKRIFFEHEENGEPAERYKHISSQSHIRRHVRPREAMIECGVSPADTFRATQMSAVKSRHYTR